MCRVRLRTKKTTALYMLGITTHARDRILDLLKELQRFPVTVPLLRSTKIGVTINKLRKHNKDHHIVELAKVIIRDWKKVLESSYKNNAPSAPEFKQSPTRTEPARDSAELNPPPMKQQATAKEKKLKRSHSTDVQSSSHTSKNPERRLSLNTSLPTSASSKSSTTYKEESPSNPLGSSPTCSSPPSTFLLPPSYATGNSVRDKCVDMVAAALKTDGDFIQFGANCDRLAWEIEEYIYQEIKATDMKYRNRIRSRISNLKDPKNPNLRRNVLCGSVSAQSIATMTAEEMASDELKELRNTLTQEAIREHQMAKTGGTTTDLLQCDKCRKKNCTYNQVQTRSADEPMTTFVLCNECGHRWKAVV
ncbi:PREDICTED: transcription elongation factor A protein 3-like [Nanorana parkeri]|uniref:transcription elongation factor A protein 3-like n=1 Tax=Nanorana parkeri TaxID=125878 RepID=UPI00085479BF|nr:PREDICTED: transcription elongation factor A protein 3-like [Nanorana parkeri]